MAQIIKRSRADGSSSFMVRIRIVKDQQVVYQESRTFDKKRTAEIWARKRESELDDPRTLEKLQHAGITVRQVLHRYRTEMTHLRQGGRSKDADLKRLEKSDLGDLDAIQLTSRQLVDHVMGRLKDAQPQTVRNDLVWLRVAFKTARTSFGWPVALDAVEEAWILSTNERLIARPKIRERRPTPEELERLVDYFHKSDGRRTIPMVDILWFAVYSARRQAEITRLRWDDLDPSDLTGMVRDLKHPREKWGNHKRFAFTRAAWELVQQQPRVSPYVFPFNEKSVSAAFTRACKVLEIEDLHFHDLRHEATSRLFEAGYSIQEVCLFTLHEDWKVLQRYTHLRPGQVTRRD